MNHTHSILFSFYVSYYSKNKFIVILMFIVISSKNLQLKVCVLSSFNFMNNNFQDFLISVLYHQVKNITIYPAYKFFFVTILFSLSKFSYISTFSIY